MRIIIAADTYFPNVDGASHFSQRLAEELLKRGRHVLVIAPSLGPRNGYFSHHSVPIFGLYSLPTLLHKNYRFTPPLSIKKTIRRVIKEFRPDIVHIQGHFFIERAVASAAARLSIPVIGTNHFMPQNLLHYLHAPLRIEAWIEHLVWKDFCSVFEKMDIATTPTETARQVLASVGLKKPVIALSCGIDIERFNPKSRDPSFPARYPLPHKPFLLCVGRLAREKNIDCILRALAEVIKKMPMHLVVAGDGMERRRLESLAKQLGIASSVSFLGFVPDSDMPYLYPLAAGLVVAGTVELQSLATLEAMASGLPVIAARALALPELAHHGENGYLFSPGDYNGLADCIERLLSDPARREAMGRMSRKIAETHDSTLIVSQFERLYRSLIAKAAAPTKAVCP